MERGRRGGPAAGGGRGGERDAAAERPAASEATARQFFTDPVAVESARQMLARDGQPLAALEAMRVERVFAQRADQSDVYSCYDGV